MSVEIGLAGVPLSAPDADAFVTEPPPKRARPAEAVRRMPEQFHWGPFTFTKRRSKDAGDTGGWQIYCPHEPEPSRTSPALLRCTREMKNKDFGAEEEDRTVRRLKQWALALPRSTTRTEHMAFMSRIVLEEADLLSGPQLDAELARWLERW